MSGICVARTVALVIVSSVKNVYRSCLEKDERWSSYCILKFVSVYCEAISSLGITPPVYGLPPKHS